MSEYEVIYLLKPIKEVEPGWWKLKWKPIFRQTWSLYRQKGYLCSGIGFRWWRSDANNGWGRSYKHLFVEFMLPKSQILFWVRWNFIVMEQGPMDTRVPRPLDLSQVRRK